MSTQAPEQTQAGHPVVTALALAESARLTQLATRASAMQMIAHLWPTLNLENPSATWDQWLAAMSSLVTRFHQQMAQDAALLYRGTRQLELGDPGTAVLASPPSEDWMKQVLGYSAPGVYNIQRRNGAEPEAASRQALATTLGSSTRVMLDGARETTAQSAVADVVPVRYYRVTDGDPCYFCALSASRGAIFHSLDSAGRKANADFVGEGDFKFHDNCGCTAAPAFGSARILSPTALHAKTVYEDSTKGVNGKDKLRAFRRAWESRDREAVQAA